MQKKEEEIQELKESEKEYFDIIKTYMKNGGNAVNNNNNTTINNINMFFIMRTFDDALNYKDLMKAPLTSAEKQCMLDHGGEDGGYNLIVTRCIDGIAIEKRPFHCVDEARQKFLLRNDDTWEIDSKGRQIIETIYPEIVNVCAPKPISDIAELKKFKKQHVIMNTFANGGNKRIIKRLAKKTLLKNNVNMIKIDKNK